MSTSSRLRGRAARLVLIGATVAWLGSAPPALAAPAALDDPPVPTTPDEGPLPGAPTAVYANTMARTATVNWMTPLTGPRPTGYKVYFGDALIAEVPAGPDVFSSADVSGLEPESSYAFSVASVDAAGRTGPRSAEITARTRQESAAGVRFSFTVRASFSLPTLVKGREVVAGRLEADVDPESLAFTADLALDDSVVRLVNAGTAPVVATLGFAQSGKMTGTFRYGRDFTARVRLRIKVRDAKLYGAIPIAAGNGCQTKQLVDIQPRAYASFGHFAGGLIDSQFAMSDLNGCGALDGLVSPRTATTQSNVTFNLTPVQP